MEDLTSLTPTNVSPALTERAVSCGYIFQSNFPASHFSLQFSLFVQLLTICHSRASSFCCLLDFKTLGIHIPWSYELTQHCVQVSTTQAHTETESWETTSAATCSH